MTFHRGPLPRRKRRPILALLAATALLSACASGEVANSTAYFTNKDFATAREGVRSVLDNDPDNKEALALLGWSEFMLDRLPEAQTAFRRVLALDETHFDGLLGMAWTTIKQGELDVAEEYLGQAHAHMQFEWQRRFIPDARGWIALHRGDLDAAQAFFREELQLSVEVWDKQADGFVGLGWVAFKRGNLDTARAMFARGLGDSDKCFFCRDGLARVALERKELDEAVTQATAAVAIAPRKVSLVLLLDGALEKLADPERRIAVYEGLSRRHPGEALLQERLGQAYRSAGQNASARSAFERALRLDPDLYHARDGLEAVSRGARLAPGRSRAQATFASLRRVGLDLGASGAGLRHQARFATTVPLAKEGAGYGLRQLASIALYNQGWALIDAGRLDEAERAFRAAQSQVPEPLKWTTDDGLGWVAYYRRDYDKAHALFTKVLQSRPEAYLSLKGLGFIAIEKKNYDEAIKHLVASLSQNPYQVPLSFTIPAQRLIDAKRFEHARKILEIGEWSYPRSAEIQFLLARSLFGMNDRKKAIEKATLAAGLDPVAIHLLFDELPLTGRDAGDAYRTLAWGLYLGGDAGGAFRRFDQYLNANSDDPDALRGRGFALFRLGRFEEAIVDLQKVAQFEPDRLSPITEEIAIPGSKQRAQITYNAASTLAWAHFRLNRAARAEVEFRKVLKVHPFWADALTGLGYSLLAQSDREGAARNFREALRISPAYYDARRGLTLAEAVGAGPGSQAPGTPGGG